MRMIRSIPLIFAVLCYACNPSGKSTNTFESTLIKTIQPKYAKGFKVNYYQEYKELLLLNTNDSNQILNRYIIQPNDTMHLNEQIVINKIPNRVISLSSVYAAFLDKLDLQHTLFGISKHRYINTPSVKKLIEEGKIEEVGDNTNLNIEKVWSLNVDLIITYATGDVAHDVIKDERISQTPVLYCREFLETHPLGKAEWIKAIAVFFKEEEKADRIFGKIETAYLAARAKVDTVENRPTVFTNIKYGDVWYVPGGKNITAKLLNDAGAQYLWQDDMQTGNLPLSFEVVYKKAINADFWLNIGDYQSKVVLADADERYTNFTAYENNHLYNNNKRVNELGGNDYWESGVVNPHIVLKDLIKIFHPEVLPEHELYYYQKLQ